ncbi:hypothetical protein M9458_014927, partial [Cirrhinus mrigala]
MQPPLQAHLLQHRNPCKLIVTTYQLLNDPAGSPRASTSTVEQRIIYGVPALTPFTPS